MKAQPEIITQAAWQRPALMTAAILSADTLILFWDGKYTRIVEKGLIGFIISVATLIAAMTLQLNNENAWNIHNYQMAHG